MQHFLVSGAGKAPGKGQGRRSGMTQLQLTGLTIYPIKSTAGISVEAWDVDRFGLLHDRRWMVVDLRGHLITQRECRALALVHTTIYPDHLAIRAAGTTSLRVPLVSEGRRVRVRVWDDWCEAIAVGPESARWFTDYLGTPARLVYMPDSTHRPANTTYAPESPTVSFADAFPFLLISEESLTDLNGRLATPVPMNRFRPNLVIEGGVAFIEDSLREFALNGIRFRVVKPCDRCVVTTTDQETAERRVEPLRTLAAYRRVEGKVYFGQNVVHQGTGRLQVGASLLV